MPKDFYSVLGVSKTASPEEIKKAYRKLAHTHHPDKKGGDEARFKEINEAYSVLGDAEKRRQYDQFGQSFGSQAGGGQGFDGFDFSQFGGQGFGGFGSTNFEDLFTDIFTGGRSRGAEERGQDIQVDVEIDFEDMVWGTKVEVPLRSFIVCDTCHGTGGKPGSREESCGGCQGEGRVKKQIRTMLGIFTQVAVCERCRGRGKTYAERCSSCDGTGRMRSSRSIEVNLPAGIEDGQAVSLRGEGEAGEGGIRPGDLFVVVHVRPHEQFRREGQNLLSTLPLTYTQLVLGDKVEVPTLSGSVTMKIPAGTEPGSVFRIRGGGIPQVSGFGTGDHLVTVTLNIPKNPSRTLRRAIESLDTLI